MKLAFSGEGRYADYSEGYELYCNRKRYKDAMEEKLYHRIVRRYCNILAERLCRDGIVDLPSELGSIAAVTITRKPQYRGRKFIGYGKMDWEKGHLDGTLKTFGIAFIPKRTKTQNLRCYGFVANRRLFKRVREVYQNDECPWVPMVFNNEMI